MGLLRDQKLLFCHIAKNAGQTVHLTMAKMGAMEFCDKHYSMLQLKQLLNDDIFFNECIKICIVRNPWDRMISTYFYRKSKCEPDFGPIDQWNLSFNEWIKYIYSDEYNNLNLKHQGTLNNIKYHFGSSLRWVIDDKYNIMVDKIIRFENLNDELIELFKEFGYNEVFYKNNSTSHEDAHKYYNEESKQLVSEHFKEDIEYFGYKFNDNIS